MNYNKEQITLMKSYKNRLRYNLLSANLNSLLSLIEVIDFIFKDLMGKSNYKVKEHYKFNTRIKQFSEFSDEDIVVWANILISQFDLEIKSYENIFGTLECISNRACNLIESKEKDIHKTAYKKDNYNLTIANIISVIGNVLSIGGLFTKKEIPFLDEAVLALKGVEIALKQSSGNLTNKDKMQAGLDLMFYVASKATNDEKIKKQLTVSSLMIDLTVDFFVND